jgi:hypothetical protein
MVFFFADAILLCQGQTVTASPANICSSEIKNWQNPIVKSKGLDTEWF